MHSHRPVELTEFNRILRSTLLLPVALLALLAGLLVWQIQQTLEIQREVNHSDRVISQLNTLERLAVDQETGMRGYQLTGLPETLEQYHQAAGPIQQTVGSLEALTGEDRKQTARLQTLEQALRSWQSFAAATIDGRNQAADQGDEITLRGKGMMDALRRQVREMVGTEAEHRDMLAAKVRRRLDGFLGVVLILALASGILIGIFTSSRLRLVSRTYDAALQQLSDKNEELTGSQQLLLTTLESIGDAVITCDETGCIRFMNAVAQQLTQWPLAEATGKPVSEVMHLVHELTRQPASPVLEEVTQSRSAGIESHNLLIARDGTEYVIDHTTSPLRNPDGTGDGFVIVFRDVTELRRVEATLIANEKLAVTGRLAASIAHEIHNPLDSVSNLHFLLGDEHNPQKRAEYLALAQQELGRTLQISRAMLSLYRESQVPVRVNLQELIGSVLLLLDRKLKDQDITVEQQYTQPTEVQGFPGELRQVFTNLIANAAEAAGTHGRMRIKVRPATPQEGRAGTLVEISDSGPGIAPHVEKKLFQPFITTKGERGTGLGLWVSLGIIQKHGGTVRISNNLQGDLQGALVRVYLPESSVLSEATAPALS